MLTKANGFVVGFFWIYTNEKNVLLSKRSIPKQIKNIITLALKRIPHFYKGLGGGRSLESFLGVNDIQFCLLNILDLLSSIKIVSFSAVRKL
jgi:hypothetical protein